MDDDGRPAARRRWPGAYARPPTITTWRPPGLLRPGYRNMTPAHPERGFTGREQVRRNWEQIFAAIPDLSAEILSSAVDDDTIWTEWEHRGTRPMAPGISCAAW